MSAKAGAESRRFSGRNVCLRRQEPRADDFQDVMYVCEGRSREQTIFRMKCMSACNLVAVNNPTD